MNFYWIYDMPNWALCTLIVGGFSVFSTIGIRSTRKLAHRLMARPHGQNEAVGIYVSAIGVFYEITLKTFDEMAKMGRARLQNVPAGLPGALWSIVILGALLNIFLTWMIVRDNDRAHIWLGIVFNATIGILIFLTAAMDNPFRGDFSVSSDSFQMVYDQLMKTNMN